MAKHGTWEWIKRATYIIVAGFSIIGMIVAALNYFARAKTVELLDMRLELAIEDDSVSRAEQDVIWMKQQTAFERREESMTVTEKEMIGRAEEKLIEQKKRREQKQEVYEKSK